MQNGLFRKEIMPDGQTKRRINVTKLKKYGFIASIVTWPLIIFAVYWAGGNLTRIALSFEFYNQETQQFEMLPWDNLFRNFKQFFDLFEGNEGMGAMFGRSLIVYGVGLCLIVPNLFISFGIYKKIKFSEFFKVVIFAPHIVSGVVWVLVYRNIIEFVLPKLLGLIGVEMSMSLFMSYDTVFQTLLGYQIWMGLGGNMVLYTGTFSKIPQELVEAGKVDGMNTWQEFWYISFPMVFSVVSISLFTGVVGIFTNSPSTFTFFGADAPAATHTFGYYFFSIAFSGRTLPVDYPYAAACSILFTLVAAPLSFLIKHLCETYGPGREE